MRILRPKIVFNIAIVLGFIICLAVIYQQFEEIESNENYWKSKVEELEGKIAEYDSRMAVLLDQNSELEYENGILMSSLANSRDNPREYSRYIKLQDGSFKWITLYGCDDIISLMGANFCLHNPTIIPYGLSN